MDTYHYTVTLPGTVPRALYELTQLPRNIVKWLVLSSLFYR